MQGIIEFKNTGVYGLTKSVKASGYPMSEKITNSLDKSDWNRAKKLATTKGGSGHDCFLKGIIVQVDITAPQYWWLQEARYHFVDTISSQSTMHKITKMDVKNQCNKWVLPEIIKTVNKLIEKYNNTKTNNKIEVFHTIISNYPMGFMITKRITTNYLQLKTMYAQRSNHKLIEWEFFKLWVEGLNNSEYIVGDKNE